MKESMPPRVSKESFINSRDLVIFLLVLYLLSLKEGRVKRSADNTGITIDPFVSGFKKEVTSIEQNPPFYIYNQPTKIDLWRSENSLGNKASSETIDRVDITKPTGEVVLDFIPEYLYDLTPTPISDLDSRREIPSEKDEIFTKIETDSEPYDGEDISYRFIALMDKLKDGFNKKAGIFTEKGVIAGVFRNKIDAHADEFANEIKLLPTLHELYKDDIKDNQSLFVKDVRLQKLHLNLSLIIYDLYSKGKLKNILDLEKDSGIYYKNLVKNKNKGKEFYIKINQSSQKFAFIVNSLNDFINNKGEYFMTNNAEYILKDMTKADNDDLTAKLMVEILVKDSEMIGTIKKIIDDLSK